MAPQCLQCGHLYSSHQQLQDPYNPGVGGSYQQPPPNPMHNPNQGYEGHPGYHRPYAGQPDSNKLLITLLLWFFLGSFGVHRFFLGHTNTGIAMLSLMILGIATSCILIGYVFIIAVVIWSWVDLVLILTSNLRPTDGTRLL